jgi:hypothetical protein
MIRLRILLPSVNIWSGYQVLGEFLAALAPYWGAAEEVTLDFSRCTFLVRARWITSLTGRVG